VQLGVCDLPEVEGSNTKQGSESHEDYPTESAGEAPANWDNRKNGEVESDKYAEMLVRLGLLPGAKTVEETAIKPEGSDSDSEKKFQALKFDSNATQRLDINKAYVSLAKNQITVVIPTLNEAEGIAQLLDEVAAEGFRNILVVDAYSTDKTVELVHQKGVKVIYQHGSGKAGAVITALERVETPYVLFMDGDCTYDSKDIWRLLNHADRYSHVIGARNKRSIPKLHRFGNWVISQTFSLLFGVNLSDVCSGMYLLETEVARSYRLRERGFVVEIELAASSAADDEVTEVPIRYRPRVGEGKLKAWHGFPILLAAFTLFRRYNPLLLYSGIGALSFIPAVIILGWVATQELTRAVWHSGWVIVGVMLMLAALQSFTLASMSILTRHSEERLMHEMKRTRQTS
jgi:dolichol-phosphate mannosyltransferase